MTLQGLQTSALEVLRINEIIKKSDIFVRFPADSKLKQIVETLWSTLVVIQRNYVDKPSLCGSHRVFLNRFSLEPTNKQRNTGRPTS